MSLVFHFAVALVLFTSGPTSSLLEEAARSSNGSGIAAPASTEAAQCELSASESLDSTVEAALPGGRQGYCLDDCSPCERREDCASPQFPQGITCTSIPLC
jgi:hypothetical protein